jgi:hypothetical protein
MDSVQRRRVTRYTGPAESCDGPKQVFGRDNAQTAKASCWSAVRPALGKVLLQSAQTSATTERLTFMGRQFERPDPLFFFRYEAWRNLYAQTDDNKVTKIWITD